MRVMVVVKASKESEAGAAPDEKILTAMGAFNEELVKAGVMLAGEGLHPSSKGKRVRFSGATRGFCVGHIGPEAAIGGPIALLRDGDVIEIDADAGTLNVKLATQELADRRQDWKPRESEFGSGYIWKYAQQVGPAVNGAVTHPGGAAEKACYADI